VTKVTKNASEKSGRTAPIAEGRATGRLTSRWCKDAENALRIRWLIEAEQEGCGLQDAVAA